MKEMFLLGAGASHEAEIPLAYELTQKIANHFRQEWQLKDVHAHVISFVIGGLLFQKGVRGDDPSVGVDVEELFNAVQLLANRDTLEVAPFVASWHSMVDKFDRISPKPKVDERQLGEDLLAALESTSRYDSTYLERAVGNIVGATLEAVRQQQAGSGEGRIFSETNEQMIQALKPIVWLTDASKVKHLQPLIGVLEEQKKLVVSTLNYDNAVELLSDSNGIPYETGINEWSSTGSITPADEGLFILKLHGSIDWAKGKRWNNRFSRYEITKVHSNVVRDADYDPAIIFGQRNKLTAEGPFLELLRVFRQELFESMNLTVIGYSFRDQHINEYLLQWLYRSTDSRMRIIDPGFNGEKISEMDWRDIGNYQDVGAYYIKRILHEFKDRIEIITEGAGTGMRKVFEPSSISSSAIS